MFSTKKIIELINSGQVEDFYNDRSWRNLAAEVRREQHFECQYCKAKGKVTPAAIVHHVLRLKEHPELAYEKQYIDSSGNKQLQLVALCFDCHEDQHPERRWKHNRKNFRNPERW